MIIVTAFYQLIASTGLPKASVLSLCPHFSRDTDDNWIYEVQSRFEATERVGSSEVVSCAYICPCRTSSANSIYVQNVLLLFGRE